MTLYFIGLGLYDKDDISIKGLNTIKKCDKLYLEYYTSKLNNSIEELEELYNNKIILADRELVEKRAEETILADAKEHNVGFLVVGDIFSATTHVDLWIRAKELGIETKFIHSSSVFSGIAVTGLQLYKFGKTSSIPFPAKGFEPTTPYDVLAENQKQGLHTLLLLDLHPTEKKYMSVNQAIEYLFKIESEKKLNIFTDDTLIVGCARLGSDDQTIIAGKASKLKDVDFGEPLHCLIIPGKLHFVEEGALRFWELI